MNPNSAQSAGGGQNPFLQILSQMQQGQSGGIGGSRGPVGGGGMPSAGGQPAVQGGTPGGAPMPQPGMPGGQGSIAGQNQPGTNATKMLITAL